MENYFYLIVGDGGVGAAGSDGIQRDVTGGDEVGHRNFPQNVHLSIPGI